MNKHAPFVLTVLLAVFLSACASGPCDNYAGDAKDACAIQQLEKTKDARWCEQLSDEERKNECRIDAARFLKNPAGCARIETAQMRDDCYYDITVDAQGNAVCDRIENADDRAGCYSKAAFQLKNPELCVKSGSYEPYCYTNIAFALGNAQLCERVISSMEQGACYGKVGAKIGDVSLCAREQNLPNRDICIGNAAWKSHQSAHCADISPGERRDYCYLRFAIATANPALCEKVAKEQASCSTAVAELAQKVAECRLQESSFEIGASCYDRLRDSTWSQLSWSDEDTGPCDLAQDATTKGYCYGLTALLRQNTTVCETLDEPNAQDGCFAALAIRSRPQLLPVWCERIRAQKTKDSCYYAVARDSGPINHATKSQAMALCAQVVDSTREDSCKRTITTRMS